MGTTTSAATLPEIGQRVMLSMEVDRFPDALVEQGALGTVSLSGEHMIEVRLDERHDGLAPWDNCLQWNAEMECENGETLAEAFWSQVEEAGPSPAP